MLATDALPTAPVPTQSRAGTNVTQQPAASNVNQHQMSTSSMNPHQIATSDMIIMQSSFDCKYKDRYRGWGKTRQVTSYGLTKLSCKFTLV